MKKKIIIMGAAGRDFHNFNVLFRDDPDTEVVAFTAAQIPFIGGRLYPPELAGPRYPGGIPIHPEEELAYLVRVFSPDAALFSYSDTSHEYVMHRASLVTALGVDFILAGAERTMLVSKRPVISVCAVRTGCGKSAVTRYVGRHLLERGKRPVAIRHPMPYGELTVERSVQRFSTMDEIEAAGCTIEEMEEFEPLVASGLTVYAGIDYGAVLKEAEKEAEILIWDGGNNDMPFIRPDLEITVADPLRPGDEVRYYPGEANIIRADCVVINKVDSAGAEEVRTVTENIKRLNPGVRIIKTASKVNVAKEIKGKKVLVIEDGPTLTHGGMAFGAGTVAARSHGAEPVDVRPYAVGTIKEALERYPHLQGILPALGYSKAQMEELETTINKTPADLVLVATPVDLTAHLDINKPAVRVTYEIEEKESPGLAGVVDEFIERPR